jgi:hypothetical protein
LLVLEYLDHFSRSERVDADSNSLLIVNLRYYYESSGCNLHARVADWIIVKICIIGVVMRLTLEVLGVLSSPKCYHKGYIYNRNDIDYSTKQAEFLDTQEQFMVGASISQR